MYNVLLLIVNYQLLINLNFYAKAYFVFLTFHESALDVHYLLAFLGGILNLAHFERRDDRCVILENLERAEGSRNQYALHLTLEDYFLRRYYL